MDSKTYNCKRLCDTESYGPLGGGDDHYDARRTYQDGWMKREAMKKFRRWECEARRQLGRRDVTLTVDDVDPDVFSNRTAVGVDEISSEFLEALPWTALLKNQGCC